MRVEKWRKRASDETLRRKKFKASSDFRFLFYFISRTTESFRRKKKRGVSLSLSASIALTVLSFEGMTLAIYQIFFCQGHWRWRGSLCFKFCYLLLSFLSFLSSIIIDHHLYRITYRLCLRQEAIVVSYLGGKKVFCK